jgi:predicted nucleic acid-binding protein
MMNSDIKEIASFDEDFDIFNDIERICWKTIFLVSQSF